MNLEELLDSLHGTESEINQRIQGKILDLGSHVKKEYVVNKVLGIGGGGIAFRVTSNGQSRVLKTPIYVDVEDSKEDSVGTLFRFMNEIVYTNYLNEQQETNIKKNILKTFEFGGSITSSLQRRISEMRSNLVKKGVSTSNFDESIAKLRNYFTNKESSVPFYIMEEGDLSLAESITHFRNKYENFIPNELNERFSDQKIQVPFDSSFVKSLVEETLLYRNKKIESLPLTKDNLVNYVQDLKAIMSLLSDGVKGLAFAHESDPFLGSSKQKGILHRDFKGSNVMIVKYADTYEGRLIDFGIGKSQDLSKLTKTMASIGSPLYFAPEVRAGDQHHIKSDVFSAGLPVVEAITGLSLSEGVSLIDSGLTIQEFIYQAAQINFLIPGLNNLFENVFSRPDNNKKTLEEKYRFRPSASGLSESIDSLIYDRGDLIIDLADEERRETLRKEKEQRKKIKKKTTAYVLGGLISLMVLFGAGYKIKNNIYYNISQYYPRLVAESTINSLPGLTKVFSSKEETYFEQVNDRVKELLKSYNRFLTSKDGSIHPFGLKKEQQSLQGYFLNKLGWINYSYDIKDSVVTGNHPWAGDIIELKLKTEATNDELTSLINNLASNFRIGDYNDFKMDYFQRSFFAETVYDLDQEGKLPVGFKTEPISEHDSRTNYQKSMDFFNEFVFMNLEMKYSKETGLFLQDYDFTDSKKVVVSTRNDALVMDQLRIALKISDIKKDVLNKHFLSLDEFYYSKERNFTDVGEVFRAIVTTGNNLDSILAPDGFETVSKYLMSDDASQSDGELVFFDKYPSLLKISLSKKEVKKLGSFGEQSSKNFVSAMESAANRYIILRSALEYTKGNDVIGGNFKQNMSFFNDYSLSEKQKFTSELVKNSLRFKNLFLSMMDVYLYQANMKENQGIVDPYLLSNSFNYFKNDRLGIFASRAKDSELLASLRLLSVISDVYRFENGLNLNNSDSGLIEGTILRIHKDILNHVSLYTDRTNSRRLNSLVMDAIPTQRSSHFLSCIEADRSYFEELNFLIKNN